MVEAASPRQHLFTVRLWLEVSPGVAHQWRGVVEHVPSGLRLYFSVLDELNDFMVLRVGSPALNRQRFAGHAPSGPEVPSG